MRKIIGNKIYDTERATKVSECAEPVPFGGTSVWTLYRTEKGAWFNVKETRSVLDNFTNVGALSEEQALEWMIGANVDIDVISKYFTIEEA